MQVHRIEDEAGNLLKLEFRDGDNLKQAIQTWVQANYPAMGWQEFFQRLEDFSRDRCRIDMT